MLKKTRKKNLRKTKPALQYVFNSMGSQFILQRGKLFRNYYDDKRLIGTQAIRLYDLQDGLRKGSIPGTEQYGYGRSIRYTKWPVTYCRIGGNFRLRIGCQHFWGENAKKILRAARITTTPSAPKGL
jgi:hypothetical protein